MSHLSSHRRILSVQAKNTYHEVMSGRTPLLSQRDLCFHFHVLPVVTVDCHAHIGDKCRERAAAFDFPNLLTVRPWTQTALLVLSGGLL